MLVPRFLFGDAREVRANIGKALTNLKRGASLEQICENSGFVDITELPESWIWIERAWSMRPVTSRDYRAVTFTDALFDRKRLPFEKSNEVREQSVEYLSRSPWGTAILNSGQGFAWLVAFPRKPVWRPSRRAYVALLAGTLAHWNALTALGSRYYSGADWARTFPGTLPAYGAVLAGLGIDPKSEDLSGWRDIGELSEGGALVERLRTDDDYWNAYVRAEQARFGAPELTIENLEEIVRLCRTGSWRKEHWAFVREHCGPAAVDAALAQVIETCDLRTLMGVYVHALDDMERAAALYSQHAAKEPELEWAASRVAQYLATRAVPPRR